MSSGMHTAWDAAFRKWQSARAAVDAAPADLPGEADDQLLAIDGEAWCSLLALPAPDWVAAAWKVRQLLDPGTNNQTSGWDGDLVRPLFADLDRLLPKPGPVQRLERGIDQLIAQAKDQNGTTREDHSHAAPDQQKSEEIIAADTENSTATSRPEGASAASPIRQLALMREVAGRRSEECPDAGDLDATAADRHWDRQYHALGVAIMSERPLNVADAVTVLACVSEMRDLAEPASQTNFASLVDNRDRTELTSIAVNNCLPILAAAVAADALTPGQHLHIAWAANRALRREKVND